jgi:hypothetical protein
VFTELNLDCILSKIKSHKTHKKRDTKYNSKQAQKPNDLVEPVTFEMNAELLRAFGPINAKGTT